MTAGQTTNQQLIYPNPDDPVPNWPQINELNSDKLDSLLGAPVFQDYTPSLSPSSGSPNIGDTGQILGRFCKVIDMYFFYIWIGLGDPNVDMGTGTLRITLPAVAHSGHRFGNRGSTVGGGYFFDSNAGFSRSPLTAKLSSQGDNVIFLPVSINMNGKSSWILQGNNPSAMTDGDQIEVYGNFKAASA